MTKKVKEFFEEQRAEAIRDHYKLKEMLNLSQDEYVKQVGYWKIIQRLEEERDELVSQVAMLREELEKAQERSSSVSESTSIKYSTRITEAASNIITFVSFIGCFILGIWFSMLAGYVAYTGSFLLVRWVSSFNIL